MTLDRAPSGPRDRPAWRYPRPTLAALACLFIVATAIGAQVSIQKQAPVLAPPVSTIPPDKIVAAITAARARVAQNPGSPDGYLALGHALRIAEDAAGAAKALDQALALDPRLSRAWYEKGLMALDSGTLPQATDLFRKAVDFDPANAPARLELASLLLRRGDWAEARTELEAVLRLDPANAAAHDGLGLILSQQGRPQEAAQQFRQALALRPSFAEAQENLGEALLQLSQWSEAAEALKKALGGNLSDTSMATYGLASALKHSGKTTEAAAEFAKATELMRHQLAVDRARSENDRGLQLWYTGDRDGAEAALRAAIGEDPNYAEAHNNLGGVMWQAKRTQEAHDEFAAAVRSKPDFAKAHNNLGNALLNEGRNAEALQEFRAAIAAQPGFASAHLNLAIALMKEGENQAARVEIERALDLDPEMAEAHLEMGLLMVSTSSRLTREARKEFEASLHLNPDMRFAIPVEVYEELILGD